MGKKFTAGQRVLHVNGGVGHVEDEYGDNDESITDVRWLTPKNEPSCCVSMCSNKDLTVVSDKVLPLPRSKEWSEKSKQFCDFISFVIEEQEDADKR